MIMNMTTDYGDPLLDLFGTESNSGNETSSPSDIPVINRSGTFNQQQFSPLLTQQQLYNTPNSGSTRIFLTQTIPRCRRNKHLHL